ncbi:hypothetical protein, partial [Propionicimonas sp.]|uniref:hypothetical protein n=1 Tax=Propionicimonas sp. TaxID=1955623 RepID=UPI0039E47175
PGGYPAAPPTVAGPDGYAAAPAGVVPGSPLTTLLGSPVTVRVVDPTRYDVGTRPEGATHARVTVTCLSAGRISFGPDARGNNPSVACGKEDVGAVHGVAWQDFELTSEVTHFFFGTSGGGKASASIQFLAQVQTRLGVNANGQTYGMSGAAQGEPDLVAVSGVDSSGRDIDGYSRRVDLDAFSPDHPGQPTSPAEAVELQRQRDRNYPHGWDVPVFTSDGTTRIGTHHVGS